MYPGEQIDTESKKKIKANAFFILDFVNPLTWLKVFFIIKKQKPNLVIFHWVSPAMSPIFSTISFLVRHFTKTKILLICHNVLPHEKKSIDKFLAKILFYNIDFFIVNSKKDMEDLEMLKKNANAKLGFHPLYEMFKSFKTKKLDLKKKLNLKKRVILFFGYVREYKGLDYLIKAMPHILKKIDLDLLIVGEFWRGKESYLHLIKKLKIEKNVKIVDKYVPNEEVEGYFTASDVVVLPYTSATQSGIIQTAFALEKPVITTAVGGLLDVIKNNKTGFLVKPQDPASIANAVIRFYKYKKKTEFIKNIKKEKERFSWGKYVKIVEKFSE